MKTKRLLTGGFIFVSVLWSASVWFAYARGYENGERDERLCWNVTVEQPAVAGDEAGDDFPEHFVPSTTRPQLIARPSNRHPWMQMQRPHARYNRLKDKNVLSADFSVSEIH